MSTASLPEFKFKYLQVLESEEIKLEDLPLEIRRKINGLKPTLAKYKTKQSDALEKMLTKQDVDIADLILTFAEKNEPSAPVPGSTPPEPPATPPAAATPPAPEPPPAPPEPEPSDDEKKENEILAKINSHDEKLISIEDLTKILGHYPSEPQKVNKTVLSKKYLRPFFEID